MWGFTLLNHFDWILATTTYSDITSLIDNVSWEDAKSPLALDFIYVCLPFGSSFKSNYFVTSFSGFFSFLDYILVPCFSGSEFQSLFFLDIYCLFSFNFSKFFWLFLAESNDNLLFCFSLNSEVIFMISESIESGNDAVFDASTLRHNDIFSFLPSGSDSALNSLILWTVVAALSFACFNTAVRFSKVGTPSNFFFTRSFFYFVSISFENRLQFDFALLFLSFVFFIFVVALITYDDALIEFIELFHIFLVFLFVVLILLHLYKYSMHFFTFLEETLHGKFTTSFILKQLSRDLTNTFGLFLRFFLLLLRLNLYDGMDDFLDSYYIFFCDFEEDNYFDELFLLSDFSHYFSDVNGDLGFYNVDEAELPGNLFEKYFIVWGKFFMFIGFFLEELFRLSLAFYILYLIIFEIHTTNNSYTEDFFFNSKK